MNISSLGSQPALQLDRMGDLLKNMNASQSTMEDKMLKVTVGENVKALTNKGINLDLLA